MHSPVVPMLFGITAALGLQEVGRWEEFGAVAPSLCDRLDLAGGWAWLAGFQNFHRL